MAANDLNLESLQKDIDALKKDMKDMAEGIKKFSEQKLEEGKDKLLDKASLEDIKKAVEELKSKGKDGLGTVNKTIKSEPFISVAVTFGIGLITGWLLRK